MRRTVPGREYLLTSEEASAVFEALDWGERACEELRDLADTKADEAEAESMRCILDRAWGIMARAIDWGNAQTKEGSE
jgi:hypothetical protein